MKVSKTVTLIMFTKSELKVHELCPCVRNHRVTVRVLFWGTGQWVRKHYGRHIVWGCVQSFVWYLGADNANHLWLSGLCEHENTSSLTRLPNTRHTCRNLRSESCFNIQGVNTRPKQKVAQDANFHTCNRCSFLSLIHGLFSVVNLSPSFVSATKTFDIFAFQHKCFFKVFVMHIIKTLRQVSVLLPQWLFF